MRTLLGLTVGLLLMLPGLAVAAPEAICSQAAVLFCDNFEDRPTGAAGLATNAGAKTPPWDMGSGQSSVTVSTGDHFDGTKAMQFSYPACSWTDGSGGDRCSSSWGLQAFATKPELYIRHYVKWATGWVWSPTAVKHMAIMPQGGGGQRPFLFHSKWADPKLVHDDVPTNETIYGQNVGSPIAFAAGQWYCLEAHVRQNGDGTALLESWVDGVQKWSHPRAGLGSIGWNTLEISGYWNSSTSPGNVGARTRYFDNIVVSTQRIGCLGSAPPPDETVLLTTTASGAGTVTGGGSYPVGATVTPVATANAGATFTGWSGDCTGMTCTVTMTANKAVTATFTGGTTPPPTACSITPTPAAITFTHPPGGPLPPPQSVRVVTSDGSQYRTFDAGFYDAAPCYYASCPSGTLTTITPNSNTLSLAAGTYTYPLDLTAGPNCPKVSVPVVLTIGAATVAPPSMGKLTVEAQVTRCNYFLTAEPPDQAGGWVAQFLRDGANTVGNPISTPPYRRSVELFAPSHSFTVEFSKTGTIKRSPAAVTRVCP